MFGRLFLLQSFTILATIGVAGWLWFKPADYSLIATVAAATALFAAIPIWLLQRASNQSLAAIQARAEALAAGDLGAKVYVASSPEVRSLAQSFNAMGERLTERFALLEGDRRRLRGILDGLVEGVVALDADERIVFANDRAGQVLEIPAPRAVGKKFWEVVRNRALQDVVRGAIAAREPQRAEIEWPGPSPRSLAIYAAPLLGGESTGLIVVVHDVSDIRRLERLRQDFVANVSHELKTPLSVIKACVETLLDGAMDDAVHGFSFLEQIDEQSDRLHALILDLLRLARVESGDAPPEPEEVDVLSAVLTCIERHRARSESKHQQLRAQPSGAERITAWADADALDTILDNLVDNAIKYTPERGSIALRWGGNEAATWIEVADTGCGIPEVDLPRVFERFYRVDKARSRELGGTGLGLAIVKHLTQAMGGTVTARSEVGQGTTLTIRLPAKATPA